MTISKGNPITQETLTKAINSTCDVAFVHKSNLPRYLQQMINMQGVGVLYRESDPLRKSRAKTIIKQKDDLKKSLYKAQKGCCLYCTKKLPTGSNRVIDHHHVSGMIRGLACRLCNGLEGDFWMRVLRMLKAKSSKSESALQVRQYGFVIEVLTLITNKETNQLI